VNISNEVNHVRIHISTASVMHLLTSLITTSTYVHAAQHTNAAGYILPDGVCVTAHFPHISGSTNMEKHREAYKGNRRNVS
jgi:alcohol dehydrogenase class IV